jgi:hypothetical protein
MRSMFRAALAMAAAVPAMLVPSAPAQAAPARAAWCSAGRADAIWEHTFSIQLLRDGACRYYNRLTIDDPIWGAGATISWMVQRLDGNFVIIEEKQRSSYWFTGRQDTEKVNGNADGEAPDWHRVCYTLNFQQPWTCTGWAGY